MTFDPDKFDATAVYAYREGHKQGEMDAERLACLLFLCDMEAFKNHGESVTGATWVKGPRVPWPRELGAGYLGGLVLSQGPWRYARCLLREYERTGAMQLMGWDTGL